MIPQGRIFAETPGGNPDPEAWFFEFGKFECWFVCGILMAFREPDGEFFVRKVGNGTAFSKPFWAHRVKQISYSRFVKPLEDDEFEKAWHEASDDYLFPHRTGKLKRDWPDFTPDMPLGILADWMEEHGLAEAANVLRKGDDAERSGGTLWVILPDLKDEQEEAGP